MSPFLLQSVVLSLFLVGLSAVLIYRDHANLITILTVSVLYVAVHVGDYLTGFKKFSSLYTENIGLTKKYGFHIENMGFSNNAYIVSESDESSQANAWPGLRTRHTTVPANRAYGLVRGYDSVYWLKDGDQKLYYAVQEVTQRARKIGRDTLDYTYSFPIKETLDEGMRDAR